MTTYVIQRPSTGLYLKALFIQDMDKSFTAETPDEALPCNTSMMAECTATSLSLMFNEDITWEEV